MARMSRRIALACGVAAAVIAAGAAAQASRSTATSTRTAASSTPTAPPPADAKDVQAKRLVAQLHRDQRSPDRAAQAAERFPVTLYTFACGDVCQNAEALLNRRGVPFTTVNVEDAKGAEQLQKLTGAQQAPVLQVGDKLIVKGYNEARWQAMLDEAGYPKTPPRRVAAKVRPRPRRRRRAAPPARDAGGRGPRRRLPEAIAPARRRRGRHRAAPDDPRRGDVAASAPCSFVHRARIDPP